MTKSLLISLIVGLILFSLSKITKAQQTGSVNGTVTESETGQPLPGVNVLVVGTNVGTATVADGRFTLSSVPTGDR